MFKKFLLMIFVTFIAATGCHSSTVIPKDANPPNNEGNTGTTAPINEEVLDTFMIQFGAAKTEGIPYQDIESVAVLVNKQNALPSDYVPQDLVEVNIPFTFKEKADKRMMRKEAAEHLEKLFTLAEDEGYILYGVSGYRSYQTQKSLFAGFVQRFGNEKDANQISARPGESEHQTGLAMDVTSQSVNYGLVQKFGDTPEYDWLKEHAHEYGFIVRYLRGKEIMTEYTYEPWHLRYIGVDLATKLYENGLTYEEYLFFKI